MPFSYPPHQWRDPTEIRGDGLQRGAELRRGAKPREPHYPQDKGHHQDHAQTRQHDRVRGVAAERGGPRRGRASQEHQSCDIGADLIGHRVEVGNVDPRGSFPTPPRGTARGVHDPWERHPQELPPPIRLRHGGGAALTSPVKGEEPLEDALAFARQRAHRPLAESAALEAEAAQPEAERETRQIPRKGVADEAGELLAAFLAALGPGQPRATSREASAPRARCWRPRRSRTRCTACPGGGRSSASRWCVTGSSPPPPASPSPCPPRTAVAGCPGHSARYRRSAASWS